MGHKSEVLSFSLVHAVVNKNSRELFIFSKFRLSAHDNGFCFRVPVVDLQCSGYLPQIPYWKRNLHKESVRLTLMDVRIEIPKFDISCLRQYASVVISASAVNGIFMLFM